MRAIDEEDGFVSQLGPMHASALREMAVTRHFQVGTALFHEGGRGDRTFVIEGGIVKLSRVSEQGREVVLAVRGAGQLLGELSAVDGGYRSATALALQRTTALSIPTAEFRAYLVAHGDVAMIVAEALAVRLRETDDRRVETADLGALGRVARGLAELAARYGTTSENGTAIDRLMSQDELAGFIGASRESVSKALRQLQSVGLISVQRRGATIPDLEALRRVSA